jgi:hypothetical protein
MSYLAKHQTEMHKLRKSTKQKADRGYRSAEAAQAAQTDVPLAKNNFDS